MAAKVTATKRRRKRRQRRRKNKSKKQKQRKDRLNSLPDDVLITILSCLPLQVAVTTETLSRRWCGLWTNTTSIDITYRGLNSFLTDINKIRMQITSFFINSFRFGFLGVSRDLYWSRFLESWIHHICDRNVRELKLTNSQNSLVTEEITLPSVIFRTQSLVSVELVSFLEWKLRDDPDPIELPNLKNLTLRLCSSNFGWIQKQIQLCPSLEKLSIKCHHYVRRLLSSSLVDYGDYIKFSNHNLRSLSICLGNGIYHKIAINAPKLEYLAVTAPKTSTFCFDEQPSLLREARIGATDVYCGNLIMSKLYGAISNVASLALDAYVLDDVSSMFPKATRLTIDIRMFYKMNRFYHKMERVLLLLELFPVLDFLTLKLYLVIIGGYDGHCILQKPSHIRTQQRVRMRLEIEIKGLYWLDGIKGCSELVDTFSKLIEYFLRNAVNLEHFKVTVLIGSEDVEKAELELRRRNELRLIKLLYQCPTIPIGCELEFQGRFFKKSRKAWCPNGKLLPLTYAEKFRESK